MSNMLVTLLLVVCNLQERANDDDDDGGDVDDDGGDGDADAAVINDVYYVGDSLFILELVTNI